MPQRFDNRVAQVVAALFGGLLVLIGLSVRGRTATIVMVRGTR